MSDLPHGDAIDFAVAERRGAWTDHPIYGDPSWDSFQRAKGNPIVRGRSPHEWPVNCFLFIDPVSSNWYLYVGHYSQGYEVGPGKPAAYCRVHRSCDRGGHWDDLGPIFAPASFTFEEGPAATVGGAPDVSVVYHDGRYHLTYDWLHESTTWATIFQPQATCDSGIAYAWSLRPEGPFTRHPMPIYRCSAQAAKPVLGKYARCYAQTLIKRRDDWLILAMSDSGMAYSWALIAMTAARPEGPYGEWTLIRSVDSDAFHPPLMEFFPAFVHDGWVYAPSTSVAANRNFQMMFRAPLKRAHEAAGWEIHQRGSVWHGEDVENEHFGIWGQTFSGAVDDQGILWAAFPSRDRGGMGTINLAARKWDVPYRERGFFLSGHAGRSVICLRHFYHCFTLQAELQFRGTCRIMWDHRAPFGPGTATVDSGPHDLMFTRHGGLELSTGRWELFCIDAAGARNTVAAGTLAAPASEMQRHRIVIERETPGQLRCMLDGITVWRGTWPGDCEGGGALGLVAEKDTFVEVHRFEVPGEATAAKRFYLYTEALLGAGNRLADWEEIRGPAGGSLFLYGCGAISRGATARVKWNVVGTGFILWSPCGPGFGRVEVRVDGTVVGEVDCRAAAEIPSRPMFSVNDLPTGCHAVVLRGVDGLLVVDALEVSDDGLASGAG